MDKGILHELKSEVRIAKHKEQMVFDDIHIMQEFDGFSDEEIVKYLTEKNYIESEADALQWLRKYKEHEMAEDEKSYLVRVKNRSSEIAEIWKALARMENRDG